MRVVALVGSGQPAGVDHPYGTDTWVAGNRNGATVLANPTTPDIAAYHGTIR